MPGLSELDLCHSPGPVNGDNLSWSIPIRKEVAFEPGDTHLSRVSTNPEQTFSLSKSGCDRVDRGLRPGVRFLRADLYGKAEKDHARRSLQKDC